MKPLKVRKLLMIVVLLLFCGMFGFFLYKNRALVNLYLSSFNISQSEQDEREISDLVKDNLVDYFKMARGLYTSDVRDKLNYSQEKTKVYRPFKTFWMGLNKLDSAKSDSDILSQLRFGGEWYVLVTWDDEEHNTIIIVKKENGMWKESGMIGSPISGRIKPALEKAGLSLELSDNNLRKNVFYYTGIMFFNFSGYSSQVVFIKNDRKLFGVSVATLREEHLLEVFPATSIAKILPR